MNRRRRGRQPAESCVPRGRGDEPATVIGSAPDRSVSPADRHIDDPPAIQRAQVVRLPAGSRIQIGPIEHDGRPSGVIGDLDHLGVEPGGIRVAVVRTGSLNVDHDPNVEGAERGRQARRVPARNLVFLASVGVRSSADRRPDARARPPAAVRSPSPEEALARGRQADEDFDSLALTLVALYHDGDLAEAAYGLSPQFTMRKAPLSGRRSEF